MRVEPNLATMISSWEESSAAFFDASAWFLATVHDGR